MPEITPYRGTDIIHVGKKKDVANPTLRKSRWWLEEKKSLPEVLFGVVRYLKQRQNWRQNQAALFAKMYSNLPISSYPGLGITKLNPQYKFPTDRPTMNVVQSCVDALKSRLTQSKPKPMFLTNAGDYKKRKLAKDLNRFIDGEFYRCKSYELGESVLQDGMILGDGLVKIYETDDHKVGLERTLCSELFVDESDGMYGFPQQLHQLKVIDRDIVAGMFPDKAGLISETQPAWLDNSRESQETIVSQIMVCESWHLPSSTNSDDGRHVIAVANGVLNDDDTYEDDDFPFTKYSFSPRLLGFWSQGLPEQLMGTQNEINKLLYVIQKSLHLCGIPKWLIEDGSKIVSSHISNEIGGQIKYSGTKPELAVFNVLPQELYAQLERLIQYAYQQSGISAMAAAAQKPAGLDSKVALREWDDLQSDRFAYLETRYERYYIDLAKKMFAEAKRIAKRDGKYSTIYPDRKGILHIDLPKTSLKDNEYVIQAFPKSAFSKDPAQRKQEVIDLMQAGLMDPTEGRRQLDFPDMQQEEDLFNAAKERLLMILDEIVEDGKYTPTDPTMDLVMGKKLVLQYINKFAMERLPEKNMDMLRTFSTQIDTLQQAAMPPPMPMDAAGAPQAGPEPTPTSPMVPNVANAA